MDDRSVIKNHQTGEFIGVTGKPVAEFPDAMIFKTWGAASEFSQNYSPDWEVVNVENA